MRAAGDGIAVIRNMVIPKRRMHASEAGGEYVDGKDDGANRVAFPAKDSGGV